VIFSFFYTQFDVQEIRAKHENELLINLINSTNCKNVLKTNTLTVEVLGSWVKAYGGGGGDWKLNESTRNLILILIT
jgi:hypothetical protein